MSDLPNDFSWSFSKYRTFKECRRKYYYRHYEMWNGWNDDAAEIKKKCYRLSKVTDINMYVGSCVHAEIANLLQGVRKRITVHFNEDTVRSQMLRGFQASQRGVFAPKQFPLLREDIYGQGVSEEAREQAIAKVVDCLRNFSESKTYSIIVSNKFIWHRVDGDGFETVDIEGYPVHCYPDLALGYNSRLHLFDWKTGKPDSDHSEQMSAYALWAQEKLHAAPDLVDVQVLSLSGGAQLQKYEFSADDLDIVKDRIVKGCQELHELHDLGVAGDVDVFPKTGGERACRSCAFLDVCG